MYPAQALADGLYTANDLPDVVDFTYSASGNTFGPYTLTRTGTTFIGGPENEVKIELAGDIWVSGDGGGGIESFPCLINETYQPSGAGGYEITVEDQFADTYTVTAGPYSATVSRIDICNWIGTDSCGNPVSLAYASGDPYTEPFKWFASIYFGPCGDPGTAPLPGYKEGNQNTPIGEYQNGLTVS